MKYNVRNSIGRFTRRIARRKDGRFTNRIVAGRLYDFRGATVRAMARDAASGTRMVAFHKLLVGFVPEQELKVIPKAKVEKYLSQT